MTIQRAIGLRSFLVVTVVLLAGLALPRASPPTPPPAPPTVHPVWHSSQAQRTRWGDDECDDCGSWLMDERLQHEKLLRDQGMLTKGDIVWGMAKIKPRVAACFDRFQVPGLANVGVTIEPDGHVEHASVSGSFHHTATGACVEEAVEDARFPPSKTATSINYPFMLR